VQRQSRHRPPHPLLRPVDLSTFTLAQLHTRLEEIERARGDRGTSPQAGPGLREALDEVIAVIASRAPAPGTGSATFPAAAVERLHQYVLFAVQYNRHPHEMRCINVLRHALMLLHGSRRHLGPTSRNTIDELMPGLQSAGLAGPGRTVRFLDARGRPIAHGSGRRPVAIEGNLWDTVIAMTGGDPGWSVFGLSVLDGFHSVLLTARVRPGHDPEIYWSDQTHRHGEGNERYRRSSDRGAATDQAPPPGRGIHRGLDDYVVYFAQANWDDHAPRQRPFPILRLWRMRPAPSSR
jgi:hypothetical protein